MKIAKRIVSSLACLAALAAAPACTITRGSGHSASEPRSVGGFTSVDLRGIGTVRISFGEKEGVQVEAEDNILPLLRTNVEGGTLVIDSVPGALIVPTKPIVFAVTARELTGVAVGGSGNLEAPDVDAGSFRASVGGSGNIRLGVLTAATANIDISGSGTIVMAGLLSDRGKVVISGNGNVRLGNAGISAIDVKLSGSGVMEVAGGEAKSQDIFISGSGAYKAPSVECDTVTATISGSGSADLRAQKTLTALLTGSGSVRYAGRPQVSSSITGSGRLEPAAGE